MGTFYFYSKNGILEFARSDAIEFEHHCMNMTCMGVFPYIGNIPQIGQIIAWKDYPDEPNEPWVVMRITATDADCDGKEIEITGTDLAVDELSHRVIASTIKIEDKKIKTAMQTILDRQSETQSLFNPVWRIGTYPSDADDDPTAKQRYRVTQDYINMYALKSKDSTVVKKINKGRFFILEETYEAVDDIVWWKISWNSQIGYAFNILVDNKAVRDGYEDDENRYINIEEEFPVMWDAIMQCSQQAGYIIVPRVTLSDFGITGRYLDVKYKDTAFSGLRLTVNTNIVEATVKRSIDNLYTSMIGIGKDGMRFRDVEWSTADGFPVNKEEGSSFVTIPTAENIYGTRRGIVTFDTISSKSRLLSRTYEYLKSVSEPTITIDGTVADLYRMGYGGAPLRIYDTVHVVLEPIGEHLELKVTDLTIDLVDPTKTKATIGTMNDDDFIEILAGR